MAASSAPKTIKVSLSAIAKAIDHSLLHPTMTDAEVEAGLQTARSYNVAAACIKPYSIAQARRVLAGSDVRVCAVVGFPHGSSTRAAKVAEAQEAVRAGAAEIDVVVNVGKVLGGQWGYVEEEIAAVNEVVTSTAVGDGAADGEGEKKKTAILKVIFENDYLQEEHIARLCEICTRVKVAFVKTSTGYAMVKQSNGMYSYKGATVPHLKLMREKSGPEVQIKAAGGVRTLDNFLFVMSLGVTRVGATATAAILEDAKKRGIGETQVEVALKEIGSVGGGY